MRNGRRFASPAAFKDHTSTQTGVRVPCLVGVRRDMQQVQASVAQNNRRDQKRVGTAIDVPQSTGLFDGSTHLKESSKPQTCDHHTVAFPVDLALVRDGEVHSLPQSKFPCATSELHFAGNDKSKMRATAKA